MSALVLLSVCAALPVFGGGVVTNADQASFISAMAGGGYVKLAFNGTVGLTNPIVVATNTVCDATGYNITISGSNAVQLFIVPQSVTFVLSNLVLANGLAQGAGGAISNGGTVQVVRCIFANNGAKGQAATYLAPGVPGTAGEGGAIFTVGTVAVYNSSFLTNWAQGEGAAALDPSPPAPGQGGAIFNAGILLVSNSVFLTNWAQGGYGFTPGLFTSYKMTTGGTNGNGGAICNASNALIDNCLFSANSAIGGGTPEYPPPQEYAAWGPGCLGASASGGAIYNSFNLLIDDSTFTSNNCTAASGGDAGVNAETGQGYDGGPGGPASGAGLFSASGSVSLLATTFSGTLAMGGDGGDGAYVWADNGGGNGGAGGQSAGGGAFVAGGTLSIVNCTFVSNTILAGVGGAGADGLGAPGGNGGNGGNAAGGGICLHGGSAYITNATFAGNVSEGGHWGQGGAGNPPGADGTNSVAEGETLAIAPGTLTLINSILSCAPGETNIFGPIIDSGYNLSSDASGFLTNSTSFNGVDPGLGSLGNYGGPTPTIPLLPGSLAIGHADPTNFPPTDQRGYARPFGAGPDIGAFEYWPAPPNSLTIAIAPEQIIDLVFWGLNGQSFRTLQSSNLLDWFAISTNAIAQSNSFLLRLPMTNRTGAFYQTVSP